MSNVTIGILFVVSILLLYPIFKFFKLHGSKKLSSREATWLIILSIIVLLLVTVTVIVGGPSW